MVEVREERGGLRGREAVDVSCGAGSAVVAGAVRFMGALAKLCPLRVFCFGVFGAFPKHLPGMARLFPVESVVVPATSKR